MKRISCFILVLLANVMIGTCKLLPFMKTCTRGPDPEWSECTDAGMKEMYPYFMNGNEEYNFPMMDPLHEDKFVINKGSDRLGITIDITNATIYGMKNSTLRSFSMDLEKGHSRAALFIPELNMTSDYFLSGRILGLFANGSGDDVMELRDVNGSVTMDFDVVKEFSEEDGKEHEYFNVTNIDVDLDIKKVKMVFNNLFNGNKFLEGEANNFLSRNWRELFSFLGPAFNKAVADAFNRLTEDVRIYMALDEVYPYPSKLKTSNAVKNNPDKIDDNSNKENDVVNDSPDDSSNNNNDLENNDFNNTNDENRSEDTNNSSNMNISDTSSSNMSNSDVNNGNDMSNSEANNGNKGNANANKDNSNRMKDSNKGNENDISNSSGNSNKDVENGNKMNDTNSGNENSKIIANNGNENDINKDNANSNKDVDKGNEKNGTNSGNENSKIISNNGNENDIDKGSAISNKDVDKGNEKNGTNSGNENGKKDASNDQENNTNNSNGNEKPNKDSNNCDENNENTKNDNGNSKDEENNGKDKVNNSQSTTKEPDTNKKEANSNTDNKVTNGIDTTTITTSSV
ncbi:GATA zinc finger domain-containing protein 14-like isoform X2 [Periplaneta americana]|uniref:GATA zinc finger domain-containing protein 14-like isoform X2 n=1 Tax=Periplaneta americana TaxID=6978 RepID=UPI0037E915D7